MAYPVVVAGYAADALKSLTPSQLKFLQALPKAELHAHLNGCIPIQVLQKLSQNRPSVASTDPLPDAVRTGIQRLQDGVVLNEIHEFFDMFPAIYSLTSNPEALGAAARAVLSQFLEIDPNFPDIPPQAAYLELRSTPRETSQMSRLKYLETVLDEVEKYPAERAALIVSLDRRMSHQVAAEIIENATQLKKAGRRLVGIDLCGDPLAGNMDEFGQYFNLAKNAGLKITMHIAETKDNPLEETSKLLSYAPDRLGHATFLDVTARDAVFSTNICVEICLSSNLLCKTVGNLDEHHIRHYLDCNHPVAICTDDTLPFRNSLVGEYALLLAARPLGLGLSEAEVERIARMGMESRFRD